MRWWGHVPTGSRYRGQRGTQIEFVSTIRKSPEGSQQRPREPGRVVPGGSSGRVVPGGSSREGRPGKVVPGRSSREGRPGRVVPGRSSREGRPGRVVLGGSFGRVLGESRGAPDGVHGRAGVPGGSSRESRPGGVVAGESRGVPGGSTGEPGGGGWGKQIFSVKKQIFIRVLSLAGGQGLLLVGLV